MTNHIQYAGNFSSTANAVEGGYSPNIWDDCPMQLIRDGILPGSYVEKNGWGDFPLAGTQTTQIGFSDYKLFATADGTIAPVSAINSVERVGSVLALTAGTTSDNESLSIAQAYPSFYLSGSASTSGKLWFEAEIGVSSILTNTVGFFVGLAETELWTLATGVPFNAGDAITNSASAIGFRKEEDGLGVIDTVYSDRATSFTNAGDAESSIAANTLKKFGMVYNPAETTDCITFYANGLPLTTKVSRTTLTGLTNLDANALGVMAAVICDSAADGTKFFLSKWRCFQLAP